MTPRNGSRLLHIAPHRRGETSLAFADYMYIDGMSWGVSFVHNVVVISFFLFLGSDGNRILILNKE